MPYAARSANSSNGVVQVYSKDEADAAISDAVGSAGGPSNAYRELFCNIPPTGSAKIGLSYLGCEQRRYVERNCLYPITVNGELAYCDTKRKMAVYINTYGGKDAVFFHAWDEITIDNKKKVVTNVYTKVVDSAKNYKLPALVSDGKRVWITAVNTEDNQIDAWRSDYQVYSGTHYVSGQTWTKQSKIGTLGVNGVSCHSLAWNPGSHILMSVMTAIVGSNGSSVVYAYSTLDTENIAGGWTNWAMIGPTCSAPGKITVEAHSTPGHFLVALTVDDTRPECDLGIFTTVDDGATWDGGTGFDPFPGAVCHLSAAIENNGRMYIWRGFSTDGLPGSILWSDNTSWGIGWSVDNVYSTMGSPAEYRMQLGQIGLLGPHDDPVGQHIVIVGLVRGGEDCFLQIYEYPEKETYDVEKFIWLSETHGNGYPVKFHLGTFPDVVVASCPSVSFAAYENTVPANERSHFPDFTVFTPHYTGNGVNTHYLLMRYEEA